MQTAFSVNDIYQNWTLVLLQIKKHQSLTSSANKHQFMIFIYLSIFLVSISFAILLASLPSVKFLILADNSSFALRKVFI